ncbi:MAG: DUF3857 domain-containing protein [Ferruginibacter sp.]|nr:DUF3857 domain-containing protein [Ferruginibacter sp.]
MSLFRSPSAVEGHYPKEKYIRLMKFLFSLFVFVVQAAVAQKDLPGFGNIDQADFEDKDCFFDPGAEACKLIDWGNRYYTRSTDDPSSFTAMHERRVRIKILKPSGLSYGNLTIPFYSHNNDESIIDMQACTYNITEDGKIKKTRVNKSAIYNNRINNQYSEMILVFPDVKVGSVIEYKYLMRLKSFTEIKDWYFQSSIPTKYSGYQVRIPALFHFAIQPLTADSLETKEATITERLMIKGGVVTSTTVQKNFIMRNLPAVRNEPFMGSARDYRQRLSFQLSEIDYGNGNVVNIRSDWEDIVMELTNDPCFGMQIKKKPAGTKRLIADALQVEGIENRMALVYNYLKKNLRWNGRETIYCYEGIKKVFQKKGGSSGDINLLLISVLNQAGVHAVPILFSTRNNGLVNTALPFINQFNTVMALVEDKNKFYVLDATDEYAGYHLIPEKVVNTRGFVVADDNWRWLEVADTLHKYKVITAVSGEITADGMMKGDALISSSGYARKQLYKDWLEGKEKFIAHQLGDKNIMVQIDGLELDNLETDSLPLEQKLRFSTALSNTGGHYYFNLNLFSALSINHFTATERRTDIDFSFPQEYTIYGNYTLAGNFRFEELPQDISLVMPDTSIVFKRFISHDNNSLNVRISVDFKRCYYAAEEYPDLAAFYKILLSKLNEAIIIKSKDP